MATLPTAAAKEIYGIRVTPMHSGTIRAKPVSIPRSMLAEPYWLTLPLTERLGLPLRVRRWSCRSKNKRYNYGLSLLNTISDPSTPLFGSNAYQPFRGEWFYVRADGKHLDARLVQIMMAYVRDELRDLWDFSYEGNFSKAESPRAAARKIAAEKITKKAFERFWVKYRAERIKEGRKEWESMATPREDRVQRAETREQK